MKTPSDPVMLLSYINTQLRDFYPNLDDLCLSLSLDKQELIKKLEAINYCYSEKYNKFM